MKYKYYNANSHNNKVEDCSIRAISLATNRSWDDTYKDLSEHARKKGMMMDNVKSIEDYLDERYPRVCHYSRTVSEFIDEYHIGVYVISMPGHLSCIIDGINYDTFDTTNRKMWCSWLVEK